MTLNKLSIRLPDMGTPEEKEFAQLRLRQLCSLLDRSKDKEISWTEEINVRRRSYDLYISQKEKVQVQAKNGLIEKIRNLAVYSLVLDLKEMGLFSEVNSILNPQLPVKRESYFEIKI